MILYQLKCSSGHVFEGWFRNSDTYDQQALSGEIECTICQDPHVSKALMAPRLSRSVSAPAESHPAIDHQNQAQAQTNARAEDRSRHQQVEILPASSQTPPALPAAPGGTVTSQLQALQMLRALRRTVERHCENVGGRFAEEARAIHDGEAPPRGIYGDTTPEKAEALMEDGIEFLQIPWTRATDA